MSNTDFKLPYDAKGNNPTNRIADEKQKLGLNNNALIFTNYGMFYESSLVVKKVDGTPLIKNVDYFVSGFISDETLKTGQSISSYITFGSVGVDEVLLTYQALGGESSWSARWLDDKIDQINIDERPVLWSKVLGKPDAYVPEEGHLHDARAIYGMEYVVNALEALKMAIEVGDEDYFNVLREMLVIVEGFLQDHKILVDNPHQVTKAQVGLGLVENYVIATKDDAENGNSNTLYVTPLRVKEAIQYFIREAFDIHLNDFTNPHQVTKTQVGLSHVNNWRPATQLQALDATANNVYMTPLRTREMVELLGLKDIEDHKNDSTNPHQVTKAQVGLPLVENYPPAVERDGTATLRNDRYMVPVVTKLMMDLYRQTVWDTRYVRNAVATNNSIQVVGNPTRIFIYAGGAWRLVWPTQWGDGASQGPLPPPPLKETYSTPTTITWRKPSGIFNYMVVKMWGAGGSGASGNNGYAGGGGGGGGYIEFRVNYGAIPSTSTLRVGAGAAGRTDGTWFNSLNGRAGQSSVFLGATANGGGAGVVYTNPGGAGGGGAGGTVARPSIAHTHIRSEVGGAGGAGNNVDNYTGGYPGQNRSYAGAGGGGSGEFNDNQGGAGGVSTHGGNGGRGSSGTAATRATAGIAPGGGSGGSTVVTYAGGAGRVIIEYF